ncbi:hypothetical protein CHH67_06685 [Paenibacillus campinasensis]|uniref:Uncharacterized protein n=1 Tax=Paenibacillus campinasensis TaxID=66347 RepID=A0A268EZ92_9BACL|nr:hypothetical protein CHH67_06685 [Paenibacillus campinasensis]
MYPDSLPITPIPIRSGLGRGPTPGAVKRLPEIRMLRSLHIWHEQTKPRPRIARLDGMTAASSEQRRRITDNIIKGMNSR